MRNLMWVWLLFLFDDLFFLLERFYRFSFCLWYTLNLIMSRYFLISLSASKMFYHLKKIFFGNSSQIISLNISSSLLLFFFPLGVSHALNVGPALLNFLVFPFLLYFFIIFCCCLGGFWFFSTSLSHSLAMYLCIYLMLILNSQGFYSSISNSDGKYCPIFGHSFRKLNFLSIRYFGLWAHVLLGCQLISLIKCASEHPKSGPCLRQSRCIEGTEEKMSPGWRVAGTTEPLVAQHQAFTTRLQEG